MSSSAIFIGEGFFVASATQLSPGTIRVKYSTAPKAVSSAGVDDALNPARYVISGPGPATLQSAQPVSGDPLSIDLVLATVLSAGNWLVTVNGVKTAANNVLTSPFSAQFAVTAVAVVTQLNGGAEDDSSEKIIRKHLGPALKGPNWDGLIAALAVGDDMNWDNARAAFDQLFLSTASGKYLEQRANDQGLRRPLNVGISDDLFRQLAIKINANKVVHEAIREILEIYYGQDSLRAFVEAGLDEDYNLTGLKDLSWTLDEKQTFTHVFMSQEFGNVSAAKALEIAFALTRTMREAGSEGTAIVFRSPTTGGNRVRIYSGSLGLGSFARVTGGSAQNVLKFPAELTTYTGTVTSSTGYNWVYSRPNQDTTRASLTINTGTTPVLLDLSKVQAGDYVVIGDGAQVGTLSTFAIKNVAISYSGALLIQTFDVEQISFNSSALQLNNDAYRFFRPTRNSITAAGGRTVVVAQTVPGEVDITIPATTQAVNRGPRHAAYGRTQKPVSIVSLQRKSDGTVTATTSAPHGLSVGAHTILENIKTVPGLPFISPAAVTSFPATFSYPAAQVSIFARSQTPNVPIGEDGVAIPLADGNVLFVGGFTRPAGTVTNTYGILTPGTTPTPIVSGVRYVEGSTSIVSEGGEADGSLRHTHTWLATADLNVARQHHAGSRYGTGAIVTGGMTQVPYQIFSSAEQLGGIWTMLPPMNIKRTGHCQVTLPDGRVMVFGGATTEGVATATTEIFNGVSWTMGPTMAYPRTDFQVVNFGTLYFAIGGRTMGAGHVLDSETLALWRLDESSGTAIADATGGYSLTAVGGSIIEPQGKINNCRDFNTAGSHLTGAGNVASSDALLGEWTMECWFKRTTNAADVFVTYGGATDASADNVLLQVGITVGDRLYVKWERGSGVDEVRTATATVTAAPQYRDGWFNHVAAVKSFNSPVTVLALSRASNIVTAFTSGSHGYTTGDVVWIRYASSVFLSGPKTITVLSSTSFTYSETGADVEYKVVYGLAGKAFDITIYLNGVLVQTWTGVTNASDGTTSAWYVARTPEDGTSGFQGFLDDIRISKMARSQDEIRASFIAGWGNQRGAGLDSAVGALTNTVEAWILNLGGWGTWAPMVYARAHHRAVVIEDPEDPNNFKILVTGGVGYDPTILPPIVNPAFIGFWPSNSLAQPEIFKAGGSRWEMKGSTGIKRHGHVLSYVPGSGEVVIAGGISFDENKLTEETAHLQILNVEHMTWRTAPMKYAQAGGPVQGALSASKTELIIGGGFDTDGATNTKTQTWIRASDSVTSGGLIGEQMVSAVPSSTQFQFKTVANKGSLAYSSIKDALGAIQSPNAIETAIAALAQPVNDPGPYIFDTLDGLAVTALESSLTGFPLFKNQNYEELEIDNSSGIGDLLQTTGYLTLGFGTKTQTPPIKYLNKYRNSFSTMRLVLDYSYKHTADQPLGTKMTILSQRAPFSPENPEKLGAFYLTASSAGRVAAQAAAQEALAAGVNANVTIVYPGDRGLGGEGSPTQGAQKLSSIVEVFAGDDVSEEVQAEREE